MLEQGIILEDTKDGVRWKRKVTHEDPTKAVHAGDRKKAGRHVPVTTPIHTASSFFYDDMEQLDRIFSQEETGFCYARYDNPTNAALEELVAALESGHGALACASGMAAIQMALAGGAGGPAQVAWWRPTRCTAPPSAC